MVRATDSGSAAGPGSRSTGERPSLPSPPEEDERERRPRRAGALTVVCRRPMSGSGIDLGHGKIRDGEIDGLVELRADPELLLDPLLELVGEIGVVAHEGAGVLLALTQLVAVVGVPSSGLLHEAL